MALERKDGLKLLMWVALAMLLHYTALVTGQVLVSSFFAMQDIENGILTYDMTGQVLYNGEMALESEGYINRYGYGTTGYGTILAVPIVLIGLFIFSKIQKTPVTESLTVKRFPVVPSFLSLIIGLAVYFPVSYIVSYTFLSGLSQETNATMEVIFEMTPYWVLFFSTAICAPLIEELTFRGFVYTQLETFATKWSNDMQEAYEDMKDDLLNQEDGELRQQVLEERVKKLQRRSHIYVIVIQALLFGAFHMNLQQFIYASALGLLFGLMRYYTKSVWPSVLAHIGFNAFSIGLYGILQHEEWGITQKILEMSDNALLLITLAVFAVALFLFEIVVKKQQENSGKTSQNQ